MATTHSKDMNEKVTSDVILDWAIEQVQGKKAISKELWLEIAFKLNLLGYDEAQAYNQMHQAVAKKKLELKAAQEKVNVSVNSSLLLLIVRQGVCSYVIFARGRPHLSVFGYRRLHPLREGEGAPTVREPHNQEAPQTSL